MLHRNAILLKYVMLHRNAILLEYEKASMKTNMTKPYGQNMVNNRRVAIIDLNNFNISEILIKSIIN